MSNQYNSDSIQSLGILGGVRAKPASIGLESHNHTFLEILGNAIDEHRASYGNEIIVTKNKDGSVTIRDFGRGVPMGKNSEGEWSYKKVFDELWAGGKYKNNEEYGGNYLYSLGTNGVGATGTNYTSDFFKATAFAQDGNVYHVEYEKGVEWANGLQISKNEGQKVGTEITWRPSAEVFRGKGEIDDEFIIETLKDQSVVNGGLKFIFKNHKTGEESVYYYENGVIDYIKSISSNEHALTDVIHFSTEQKGKDNENDKDYKIKADIYFAFNRETSFSRYYHNSSWLENGGTPEDFIKNSFTFVIDKFLKENNLYNKNEKKISFDDIADSLIIVTSTYSTISLFIDQTKKKINSDFMKSAITKWLREQLEIYFTENPMEADKIIQQVLVNKRSREKAEQARLDIKKKLQVNVGNSLKQRIDGLNDCDMEYTELEERELWLCEGESACQTMTNSRDDRTMGTYPLRGRFISSLKNSVEDVLNNKVAMGIIQALGCGIEIPKEERKKYKNINTFNKENLRYGKIVIATDADSFGNGIAIALVTFFYKFMPTLLKENRIFISLSPRYKITTNKEELFAYNEKEKDKIVKELDNKGVKYHVGIIKGLGELNRDTYWKYVMNPDTRRIKQLIYNFDFDKQIEYYFNTLMGEDIEERKKYIKENIVNIDFSTLD